MASTVNSIITSGDLGGGLIPTEYATQIIQDAPKSSVSLTRMRQIRMSTRTRTQPVLDSKPIAYWVGGDTGLKQTTKMKWSGLSITAEELAAIVPIPEAVIADSGIPIWPEVMPRLASALGYKLDQATLFGVDKPSSFPDGIIPQAIAAHNTLTQGKDLAKDVASMGQKLAEQGFAMNGFASKPGLNWELIGLRNANGTPIYVPSLAAGAPSTLYGFGLNEVDNGAWDATKAVLLGADWSNFVVGIRQDITYKLLDQSVISDDNGKVILNLAQQDCVAMRVVFRVGFQIANPINDVQPDKSKRFPAYVIAPPSAGPHSDGHGTEAAGRSTRLRHHRILTLRRPSWPTKRKKTHLPRIWNWPNAGSRCRTTQIMLTSVWPTHRSSSANSAPIGGTYRGRRLNASPASSPRM